MSLLTTLTKGAGKIAPSIVKAGKSAAIGVAKGAGQLVKETGELGQAIGNVANKGYTMATGKAPSIPIGGSNGTFVSGSKANTSLNSSLKANGPIEQGFKFAAQVPAYVSPRSVLNAPKMAGSLIKNAPKIASEVSSGFKSASTNLAERMAGMKSVAGRADVNGLPAGKNYTVTAPSANSGSLQSGSTFGRSGASDIRPAKPTITNKTTTARNSTLDTRATPTKVNTTKTNIPVRNVDMPVPKKFPIGLTGLGLGAAALGTAALMPDGSQAPQSDFVEPNYNGSNFLQDSQGTATTGDPYSQDAAFGNNEGGVFESSTPAPQTGTAMGGSFQPGFAATAFSGGGMGGGGIGTGISGSGGSKYTAPTDEYISDDEEKKKRYYRNDAEDRAVAEQDRLDSKAERDARRGAEASDLQNKQITDYNNRIADLMSRQAAYGIDLEGSAASSSARDGLATMFDRETRKSLIPLQTSLALVQAERDRMDKLKQQQFENDQSIKTQNGFTLGNDQQRFEIDPATGEYKMVGQGFRSEDKPASQPASIQEYEYAKQQGYQGTFNDFQQQSKATQDSGDKTLTPTEAMALGVPYGTTQSQAYGNTPQKEPTQYQYAANLYAQRIAQADQNLQTLATAATSMNPALFQTYGAMEPNAIGNAFVPAEFRQLRQAERNFLTAVLRRESGASISPTEFAEGARIYFPRPGDDQQTLAQKTQARQTVAQSLQQEAGQTYQGNNNQQTTTSGFNW